MEQKNNPLHGITLEQILLALVERHGWQTLGEQINIRCFQDNPSVSSSLKFLRKTPWARAKVEALYLDGPVRRTGRKSGPKAGPKPGRPPSRRQNPPAEEQA